MFKQRVITAAILIAITFIVLFYLPQEAFFVLTTLLVLACAWEWTNFMDLKQPSKRFIYLIITTLILFAILFVPILSIFILDLGWWLLACFLIILYPRLSKWWLSNFWIGLMGLFVLAPCWAAINFIRNANDGEGIYPLIFLLVLIWGADSTAYLFGKKWGKTKLAPQVSPGKTYEGLAGAFVAVLIIALLALWICKIPWNVWPWALALSLITFAFSIVGDLFESLMKRQANLKDSSALLPGHGGLLDRLDSLTAAAPIFALGALLLGMYLD